MGGWFRNEITSVEQLRGLKFRITGLAGQLFTRLGAAPTLIAPADIYPLARARRDRRGGVRRPA
jgi:TRAP-type mannitol/chloroaromatic compound transport system substrate-binding protein